MAGLHRVLDAYGRIFEAAAAALRARPTVSVDMILQTHRAATSSPVPTGPTRAEMTRPDHLQARGGPMDHQQERAMHKKKERERENAGEKEREDEQDREETRGGTGSRHYWFFALGAVILILIVLAWTFLR
jgi:hypothetical protein